MLHFLTNLNKKKKQNRQPPADIDEQEFLDQCKTYLEKLETVRLDKLKNYKWRKKISIPIASVLTPVCGYIDYWLLMLQRGSDDGLAGLTVIALGALYQWVTSPKRQYARAYKKEMLPKIIELFGDFSYDLKGRIDEFISKKSKIFPRYDRYESEDYFSGSYKQTNIEFSEINLKQRRRSGKRTRYVTVFKGLAVLLSVNSKRFYGHTIVDKNKSKTSEWFKEKSTKLKRANLVDPKFEDIFDVYTNDQVEARYLIDPIIMDQFQALEKEYDGKGITAAFYEDKLFILIPSDHNHFEPMDIFTPATDIKSVLSMKREVQQILSLVDHLSLYDPLKVPRDT